MVENLMTRLRIPKLAMPIVKIIRRDVPRPEELPTPRYLSFDKKGFLRWDTNGRGRCCPMGLHPSSLSYAPYSTMGFPVAGCRSKNVVSFYKWWDSQEDPAAAMDAVWGKRS